MIQMKNDRNRNSVLRQLAALQNMSTEELKEKWRDLYGNEPPNFKKSFLQKRLAYRIQELFYGGISVKSQQKLSEAAGNDPLCTLGQKNAAMMNTFRKTGRIAPGTRFVREWNDKRYEVIAREKGFEYKGKIYRSLSAIATEITGTRWNGRMFFGLKKRSS
jgi:hypothetical protein